MQLRRHHVALLFSCIHWMEHVEGTSISWTTLTPRPTNTVDMLIRNDKPRDCTKLPGPAQEDVRWNFETAPNAACVLESGGMYQHWLVIIPNDHIFDETRIHQRGERACGSSVFDAMEGGRCIAGFFNCMLDRENTAHLAFTCPVGTPLTAVTEGFQKGTCNTFADVVCKQAT